MHSYARQIEYYLELLRQGDADGAFHGLLEFAQPMLPALIAAYRVECDIATRAFLVNIIWQSRDPSIVPFLGEALHDAEPRIWREALDGLVAIGSTTALQTVREARTWNLTSRVATDEFREWLDEAIEQMLIEKLGG